MENVKENIVISNIIKTLRVRFETSKSKLVIKENIAPYTKKAHNN